MVKGLEAVHITLVAELHGANDAAPRIHNAFSERNDVVVHLIAAVRASSDSCGLLQHLSDNGKIGLEMAANGIGDVTKTLQNSRLELVP
jgi:hypothetical protein